MTKPPNFPHAFLEQNGTVYEFNAGSRPFTTSGAWEHYELSYLTAEDFVPFISLSANGGFTGGTLHPDFSATGAPITFGYLRWNVGGASHNHDIDNFTVSVFHAVPEPGSFSLLLGGLAALCGFRRR